MTQLSDMLALQAHVLDLSGRQISERARAAGYTLSNKTVSVYLNGTHGTPDPQTLAAFAHVLKLDVNALRTVAGAAPEYGEYTPPESARTLTLEQRRVIDETIRLFAEGNDSAASADDLAARRDRRQREADETPVEEIQRMAAYETDEESLGVKIDRAYEDLGEESQLPPDEEQD